MAIGNPITLTNNVAAKVISATATANQTLFTVTGGYRINQIAVFRNGVLVDIATIPQEMVRRSLFCLLRQREMFLSFRSLMTSVLLTRLFLMTEQTISGSLNVTGGINVNPISRNTNHHWCYHCD